MDEQAMRAECAKIEKEWGVGGLTGGLYEDFAIELAKRVQAAIIKAPTESHHHIKDGDISES